MVVEIPLTYKLRDIALVDVIPVQAIGRALIQIHPGAKRLIGRKHRAGDVDGLQLDRKELTDIAVVFHVGNHEVHVAETRHFDFGRNLRVLGFLAGPAMADNFGKKVHGVKPLRANED